jgi:nickel/cobalt transporter (NicO) family protein
VTAIPALLAAAGGVGAGHAILPDHWVPLAVLSRTRRYGLARVARVSGAAALAHVATSLVLGAVLIVIGLQFRSVVEHTQNLVIGSLLVGTGLMLTALEVTGRAPGSHQHGDSTASDPQHPHPHPRGAHTHGRDAGAPGRRDRVAGLIVPFGAAASPDLTILPVFVAATAVGVLASIGALVVFSLVTVATIVGLTLSATFGGYQVQGAWLDRWGNVATALVLVVVGGLVLTGII